MWLLYPIFLFGMNQNRRYGILLPCTNSMSGKILGVNSCSKLLLVNQIADSLICTISRNNRQMIMIFLSGEQTEILNRYGQVYPRTMKFQNCLKLVYAIFYQNFSFFTKWQPLQNYKNVFISFKKLFSFSRYLIFCVFPSSFPHFPCSKGQMKVE